jgi:hypothetical protein
LDRAYNERGRANMKEVMEGKMVGKRGPSSLKRVDMIGDLLEREQYGDLKKKADNRKSGEFGYRDLRYGSTLKKTICR